MTLRHIGLGIAVAQTGRYALLGRQVLAGLECWAGDVNAAGGIRVGRDAPARAVTVVAVDDESDGRVARERVGGLIANDCVDVLLGPYGSGPTLAAAEVAEAHGWVMFNHSGAADRLFTRGFRWQVGIISPASAYLCGVLDALRASDPEARRVALFQSDTGFAADMADGVRAWLEREGLELATHEVYPSGLGDFRARLLPLCTMPPDWLLGVGRVEDDIVLARQVCELRPAVQAAALVVAGIDHFRDALGAGANGFLAPSQWEPGVSYAVDCGPDGAAFARHYRARTGGAPDYPAAQGYVAGLIAQRCMETAGSLGQAALRDAAGVLRCTTFYGAFGIEAGTGRQREHEILVTQWQDGERRIVWPAQVAGAALAYRARPAGSHGF